MIFASRVQKTIPIPGDPSHTVTIQKLPRRHFIRAEKAQQATVTADLREQFGDDWQEEVQKFKTNRQAPEVEKASKDPLLKFDVPTLLKYGVKAWTYEDAITDEALDDLDKDTAEHLAREVLRLSAPKLFEEADGDERKNDSDSSTAA